MLSFIMKHLEERRARDAQRRESSRKMLTERLMRAIGRSGRPALCRAKVRQLAAEARRAYRLNRADCETVVESVMKRQAEHMTARPCT